MDPFHCQLGQLRPALLRSARKRLRNPTWAEDAVSETVLAALQRQPEFHDPARLRAWLYGILRHKITDQLRLHLGHDGQGVLTEAAEGEPAELDDPSPLADPMHGAASRQFIQALQRQLTAMPNTQARAFMLRELLGEGPQAICDELAITTGNLWVMLHRTRYRLRDALAEHRA